MTARSDSSYDFATTIDRIGLAIGAGSAIGGGFAALLLALGGGGGPLMMAGTWALGTISTAVLLVVVGGPLWLIAHRTGRRGPGWAASAGAASGLVLSAGILLQGIGSPGNGSGGWLGICAIGTFLPALGAAIALTVWLVAYRPVEAAWSS